MTVGVTAVGVAGGDLAGRSQRQALQQGVNAQTDQNGEGVAVRFPFMGVDVTVLDALAQAFQQQLHEEAAEQPDPGMQRSVGENGRHQLHRRDAQQVSTAERQQQGQVTAPARLVFRAAQ